MTPGQMILVKNSWKTFTNVNTALIGDLFYSKLFLENPKLRKMFPASMDQQSRKLIDMLTFIISRLVKTEMITEDIKIMALRHEGYGVKQEHYEMVGAALLWTMEKGFGRDWNDEVKEAWQACYILIAQTMISVTKTKTIKPGK